VALVHRGEVPESPVQYGETSLRIVREMVAEAFALLGIGAETVRGRSVLLKPNLVRPNPEVNPAICTDPRVVLAVCEVLADLGAARITVGENPGYGFSGRAAFRAARLGRALKRLGVELCFFDEEERVCTANPRGLLLQRVYKARALLEHDLLLNLPKMKTHMHTLVSLGMKNLQGILLDPQRRLFHRNDIEQKIVDTYLSSVPWLTLVDALWPMQGQAPFSGEPIPGFNVLVAGENTVAVDTVCAALMGIEASEVTTLRIARWQGLQGAELAEIPLRGAPLEPLVRRFKRPVLSSVGAFPGVLVIEGGACTGCMSGVRHSLDKLQQAGLLGKLAPATIYLGKPMPNTKTLRDWQGTLYLFGNCAADIVFSCPEKRMEPVFLHGCPPHVLDLFRHVEGS
jgi:uncharacterized protein (DUF362 family)